MKQLSTTLKRWRDSQYGIALAVLMTGVGLSFAIWDQVRASDMRVLQTRFAAESNDVTATIQSRFAQHEEILRGVQGLFAASMHVSRGEWADYIEKLNLKEHFPGISGLVFVERVPADQLATYTQGQREQGLTEFRVYPEGQRDEYFPVAYGSLNKAMATTGFDYTTDAVRTQAMARARDTGRPSLTARTVLKGEEGPNAPTAALLILPIYRNDLPLKTVAERRAALIGYVASGFRMRELMQSVLGRTFSDLRVEILDGADVATALSLYDSVPAGVESPATDVLQRAVAVPVAGRTWFLRVTALPGFYAAMTSKAPLVLAGGLIISLLLFAVVLALRRSEARAHVLARNMSDQWRGSEERHRLMVESVQDYGIFMLGIGGEVLTWNGGASRIFGHESDQVIGQNHSMFYTEDDLASGMPEYALKTAIVSGRYESEGWHLRQNGKSFWANIIVTAMRDDAGRLTGFTKVVRDLTERKRAEDLVQHVAHHDALTDLPNRHLLLDRMGMAIKQAQRTQKSVGVLMVDLDHFKRINDSLGHNRGDQLLLKVAERLNAAVRNTDTVARVGGDEFVIVLPDIDGREAARKVALNIIESLSEVIHVATHDLHVTPSVGISLYPDDGADSNTLLKHADTAMYHAKSAGRNGYQWFDHQMLKVAEHKLEMEGEMRRALERNEFQLYYQPLVSLSQHRIVGMEALIRWQHPRHGLLMPDKFIPLAEETGLILPIGAWVLRHACIETQRMREQTGQSLNIAVNVSTRQFQQADFLRMLEDALASSGLPPEALTLEITESVLAHDPNDAIRLLNEIRDLGVSVAVDDFGTGYSSLSYVTRFPIAKLKIDRSFVSEISLGSSGDAVTSTIITMAHSLNLKVVAEGVENQQQLGFLGDRLCDEAQGFLFSPAVDQAAFLKLAQASARTH